MIKLVKKKDDMEANDSIQKSQREKSLYKASSTSTCAYLKFDVYKVVDCIGHKEAMSDCGREDYRSIPVICERC